MAGVASVPQRDFEHPAVEALERFRPVRFSARRRDRQGIEHVALHVLGKILEVLTRRLEARRLGYMPNLTPDMQQLSGAGCTIYSFSQQRA